MNSAKAILEQKGFLESARAIFDYCTELIGATSGYVVLLKDDGTENEVLFLEAGGLPCNVDPSLPRNGGNEPKRLFNPQIQRFYRVHLCNNKRLGKA